MNNASNFPESEQPEGIPTASDAAQGADTYTSAQAQASADDNAAAARTCPQCGAALEPGASFCTSCGAKIDGSEDVTYHIVRPEAERSYEDANFHPSDDAGNTPPRYYTPNDDAWAEKPKHKHHPRKPRTARTPEQKRLITRIACLCLVCALLGGLGGGAIAGLITRSGRTGSSSASNSGGTLVTQPVSSDPSSAAAIYNQACKQVVAITTEVTYTNYFGQTSSQASCGSGFFITDDGYVLTNYHVISTAHQYGYAVSVLTYDGTTYQATIVGVDEDNDIALLLSVVGIVLAARSTEDDRKTWLSGSVCVLIASIVLRVLVTKNIFETNATWQGPTVNSIVTWALICACISIVTMVCVYLFGGRKQKGITLEQYGIAAKPVSVAAAFCVALLVSVIAYACLFAVDAIFKTDFRIWTFAFKTFEASAIPAAVKYMPFFFVYYFVSGAAAISNLSLIHI